MKFLRPFLAVLVVFSLLLIMGTSCERIDAGHVGIRVNLYGDDRGVDNVTMVTGMVWYNPLTTKIYEFPTFVQHVDYQDPFNVLSKDGSEFLMAPKMNFRVHADSVPSIFKKYRRSLNEISNQYLLTTVAEALRLSSNKFTADSLVSNRSVFDEEVRRYITDNISKSGFILEQITMKIELPENLRVTIESKNKAIQEAMRVENEVRRVQAEAEKSRIEADAVAYATITKAKADAEATRLVSEAFSKSNSKELIEYKWIEKWNGVMPTTQVAGPSNFSMMKTMP